MSMTETIARLCVEQLPSRAGEAELANARLCFIDGLAVALAAADMAPIDMLWQVTGHGDAPAEARVIGGRGRCRAETAALVNGMMVSLLLFDDNHSEMRGHPTGPVLPAVLALGELCGATIDQALRAFIVGYEFECQLGPLLNPSQYEVGWHATATQGTFGATAAASVLLGLDAEATARALGIAASMLGGVRRNFGTMTMSYHSGLAASSGVRSAQLAAQGFTADPRVFDGAMSIGHLLCREWDPEKLRSSLTKWGDPFNIVRSGPVFKLLPTGRPTIAPIEAALEVRSKAGDRLDEIEAVICDVSFMYPRTLIHSKPVTGLQGKTSLQYCVAAALVEGRPTLDSYTDAAVSRPEIRAVMDRIQVRVPPELDESNPAVRALPFDQPVTVTLRLKGGQEVSHTVLHHKGTPANPAREDDLLEKFADCTRGRLPPDSAERLAAYLGRREAGVSGLLDLLELGGAAR
ncbi:MmgE/PrpD family protein [Alsobacter sp. SYSU M60028]|uniref:MmgE/PrpD family protein n=1 Tax=Alsobacter ponti TaxID=2962936 RepID=A0ABT1LBC4_9HYPH|nr:MmgE/PrpD family protein [Alsobacter ponti]MCP8938749.1 MmgE/PrpD family protein [Alsobacter ponti]